MNSQDQDQPKSEEATGEAAAKPAKKVAKKKTARKKTAKKSAKKKTTQKKTAKKKTAKKKTAKKKAVKTSPRKPARQVSDQERYEMIQRHAYFLAEARNFEPGHEWEDWMEAERFIDEMLSRES